MIVIDQEIPLITNQTLTLILLKNKTMPLDNLILTMRTNPQLIQPIIPITNKTNTLSMIKQLRTKLLTMKLIMITKNTTSIHSIILSKTEITITLIQCEIKAIYLLTNNTFFTNKFSRIQASRAITSVYLIKITSCILNKVIFTVNTFIYIAKVE